MSRSYAQHRAAAAGTHARVRVGIVTATDSRRMETDESGRLIERLLRPRHVVVGRRLARDDVVEIRRAADALLRAGAQVLITNGGTGLAPRDVTVEALGPWFVKEVPGFGERFRSESAADVESGAWLSRATAGVLRRRGATALAFLLPGSPDACRLAMERLILPELPHAASLLERGHAHG